jgi:hypothetical protein
MAYGAQELLESPADQRPAMLESIAKALTKRLLQDNPGIGIREVSQRVTGVREGGSGASRLAVKDHQLPLTLSMAIFLSASGAVSPASN